MLPATMSTSLEAPTPGPRVSPGARARAVRHGRDPHPRSATTPGQTRRARGVFAAIFLISAATLLLELTLTRIFDVVLWTNLANFIVSSAIFGLGLGGIAVMLRPVPRDWTGPRGGPRSRSRARCCCSCPRSPCCRSTSAPILTQPARQLVSFAALYAALLAPFFAAGVVIASILTRHARRVDQLYFWDLLGAGLGALGIIWLPTLIGPAAMLVLIAAAGVVVAGLLAPPAAGPASAPCAWHWACLDQRSSPPTVSTSRPT